MPTLPKGKKRSWITSRPTQARQMDNSAFYHSRGWRMTRKFYIKANPLCEHVYNVNHHQKQQLHKWLIILLQSRLGGSMLHHSVT